MVYDDDRASSWTTVTRRRNRAERRFRQILTPSRVFEEPPSQGIHVILVGGKPGSGVRTCAVAIQERLALQRIVCERVVDCEYVALTGPCLFCRKNKWESGCIDAPQALQLDLLYKEVERAARRAAGSACYNANRVGLALVEGPFVMSDPKLNHLSTAAIWLEQGERKCIERLLRREQKWFPPDHQDPQEYIDKLLVINDGKMKKGVDPHQHFSTWMKENATGTIDIENKSRMVVADEAMTMLRDTFSTAKK